MRRGARQAAYRAVAAPIDAPPATNGPCDFTRSMSSTIADHR